jgi:hypothetical protein
MADLFGEQAVAGFVDDGIDVSCVFKDADSPSGMELIFVDDDCEIGVRAQDSWIDLDSPGDPPRVVRAQM